MNPFTITTGLIVFPTNIRQLFAHGFRLKSSLYFLKMQSIYLSNIIEIDQRFDHVNVTKKQIKSVSY